MMLPYAAVLIAGENVLNGRGSLRYPGSFAECPQIPPCRAQQRRHRWAPQRPRTHPRGTRGRTEQDGSCVMPFVATVRQGPSVSMKPGGDLIDLDIDLGPAQNAACPASFPLDPFSRAMGCSSAPRAAGGRPRTRKAEEA